MHKLFVLDTSCFFRLIEYRLSQLELFGENQEIYIDAVFYWANALGFFPQARDRKNTKVVWVIDSKPYWRSIVYPEYKANRDKNKDDSTPRYSEVYKAIKEQFFKLNLNYLAFPGYEADDIAALFGFLWANRVEGTVFDEMFFCTPDSDWQGLIRSNDQFYLDIGGHSPRVRSKKQIYDWYVRKRGPELTKTGRVTKQHQVYPVKAFEQFRCSDLWIWKQHFGDRGDNLPPGSDLSLIDLYQPPNQYNLALQPEAKQKAMAAIKAESIRPFSAVDAESVFNTLGCAPPITYVDSDAYYLAKGEHF